MKVLKSLSTTAFVTTKVAIIVGAGLFAIAAAGAIKDRFTGNGDEEQVEGEVNEVVEDIQ